MYDTAGPEEVEVGDLALRVARMLGLFEDSVRRERDATLPEDRYVGEPDAFVEACVRHAIVPRDLDAVIARTARYLLRRPDRPGETRSGYGPHSSRRS